MFSVGSKKNMLALEDDFIDGSYEIPVQDKENVSSQGKQKAVANNSVHTKSNRRVFSEIDENVKTTEKRKKKKVADRGVILDLAGYDAQDNKSMPYMEVVDQDNDVHSDTIPRMEVVDQDDDVHSGNIPSMEVVDKENDKHTKYKPRKQRIQQ